MFVRVVRFTDVPQEKAEGMSAEIEASDGPPDDAPIKRLQVLYDKEQSTAVVLQFFDSAEDMSAGEKVFDSMDASDTPGNRVSVDRSEMKLDMSI